MARVDKPRLEPLVGSLDWEHPLDLTRRRAQGQIQCCGEFLRADQRHPPARQERRLLAWTFRRLLAWPPHGGRQRASLPACPCLGAGARLGAREEDGVRMLLAAPEADREYAGVLAAAAAPAAAAVAAARWVEAARRAAPEGGGCGAGVVPPLFEVTVDALGAAVHIIETPERAAAAAAGGAAAAAAAAAAAQGLAAAGAGSGTAGAGLSTVLGSSGAAAGAGGRPLQCVPVGSGRREGADAAACAAADGLPLRRRRRLVLSRDASAGCRPRGAEQSAQASVRGLAVRTLMSFGGAAPG